MTTFPNPLEGRNKKSDSEVEKCDYITHRRPTFQNKIQSDNRDYVHIFIVISLIINNIQFGFLLCGNP